MRAGSRRDHDQFCVTEGWSLVRDARGRAVQHHVTYELALPDGRMLRTRISRPVNTNTYGAGLWKCILRERLEVSEDEFWECVKKGTLPNRGGQAVSSSTSLPADLIYQLIHVAHVPEEEIARMNLDDAVARMHEHWSRPRP